MDEAKLQEIEARANAATPGPWATSAHGPGRFVVTADDGDVTVGTVSREVFEIYDGCAPWRFGDAPIPESLFLAAARTDVPALVAEVRRITAALATARREGAAEMLARCRTAARAAFDAHPLTLNRYHSPGCICDAIGRGSCSKCDRGDAVVDALDALPLDGDGGAPDCTGITAQWCPRCGDCTCPLLHEGNVEGGRTLNDPKCPLHAPSSPHGDGGGR